MQSLNLAISMLLLLQAASCQDPAKFFWCQYSYQGYMLMASPASSVRVLRSFVQRSKFPPAPDPGTLVVAPVVGLVSRARTMNSRAAHGRTGHCNNTAKYVVPQLTRCQERQSCGSWQAVTPQLDPRWHESDAIWQQCKRRQQPSLSAAIRRNAA